MLQIQIVLPPRRLSLSLAASPLSTIDFKSFPAGSCSVAHRLVRGTKMFICPSDKCVPELCPNSTLHIHFPLRWAILYIHPYDAVANTKRKWHNICSIRCRSLPLNLTRSVVNGIDHSEALYSTADIHPFTNTFIQSFYISRGSCSLAAGTSVSTGARGIQSLNRTPNNHMFISSYFISLFFKNCSSDSGTQLYLVWCHQVCRNLASGPGFVSCTSVLSKILRVILYSSYF